MPKNDRLFQLIKSLSKSEKRYFTLHMGSGKKHKKYLQLFQAMESQDQYNESLIRGQFEGDPILIQLHVAKNYLKNLILKSLRNYYSEDSSDMKLHNALQEIEILYKRDLFDLCLSRIHQAEKYARRYQNLPILLELLSWKRRLHLLRLGSFSAQEVVKEIIQEESKAIEDFRHLNTYWDLTMNLRNRFGDVDFAQILKHQYLKDDSNASNFRSRILYYHLLYTTHTVCGQRKESEQALNDLIDYLKSEHDLIKEDPGPYVTALNNKIGLLLNQNRYQEIGAILKEIRAIPQVYQLKQRDTTTMKLWLRSYNVELELYRDSRQVNKGIELIPIVKGFMQKHASDIPVEYHVLFRYQFANLYFMNEDHAASLQEVNHILVQRYSQIRNDIISYAHFLNLILHYELGNTTVLRYAVDATRRFIKKRGKIEPFERELLRFFSRVSTQPTSNHRGLFVLLQNTLFGSEPLLDHQQLDYLNFNHWIEHKLGKTQNQNVNII